MKTLTTPHPWRPGEYGSIVEGRWRGVCGSVAYVYEDFEGDAVLGIRPQGWRDVIEVDAGQVIPI